MSFGNLGIKLSRLFCYRTSQDLYYAIMNWHFPGRGCSRQHFPTLLDNQSFSLFFLTGYLINSQLAQC